MFRNSGKSLPSAFFDGVLTSTVADHSTKERHVKAERRGPVAIQESAQREHSGILIKLYVSPTSCREQF
jgi:hypothetical protein